MTQEDKDILLKYLCMALPYGVKVYCGEDLAMTLKQIDYNCFCECWENEDIKSYSRRKLPYLRPMSSMTEEEYDQLYIDSRVKEDSIDILDALANDMDAIDWLNAHHFDYRGLIERGLALEVTEDNNPYKE